MRVLMIFPIAVTMMAAAGAPDQKQAKPAVARLAVAQAAEIPAGAEQTAPLSYRYTGPDGKTRLYFKTPFGIMSMSAEEKPAQPEVDRSMEGVTATADGDTIRFARPTPFGMFHWEKKKSELTEQEQSLL